MSALGKLVVTLGLDTAEYNAALTKAEYDAAKFADKLGKGLEAGLNLAAQGMTALALQGSVAIAAIIKLTDETAKFQDIAEKIGGSAEGIASFVTAADTAGTAIETIAGSSVKLTRALTGVNDESKDAGAAVAALGLNLKDFKQLAPEQQLSNVAKAMAEFDDSTSKTAVAVALFGRSGSELLPFLKALEEQGGANVIVTGEMIRQADNFADKLAMQKSLLQQNAQVIASQFVPVLTDGVDVLADIAKYVLQSDIAMMGLRLAVNTAVTAFQALVILGSEVGFVFLGVGREIGAVAAQLVALARFDLTGYRAISEAVKEDGKRARAELDAFQTRVMTMGTTLDDEARRRLGRGTGRGTIAFDGAADKPKRDKEAEELEKSLQREARTIAEARQAARIAEDKSIEKYFADQRETAERQAKALGEAGARVYEATRTPLEKLNTEQIRLNDLLQKGAIDWDTYSRAVFDASEEFDRLNLKTDDTKNVLQEVGATFKVAFEDAIVEGKKLSEVLTALGADLFKLFLRKQVTEPLFNELFGDDSGGAGSFIGDIFKGLFGGNKATGGPVDSGKLYRINENGPEVLDVNGQSYLMTGDRGGFIRQPGGGGGNTVINVGAGTSRNEVVAAVQYGMSLAVASVPDRAARRMG